MKQFPILKTLLSEDSHWLNTIMESATIMVEVLIKTMPKP